MKQISITGVFIGSISMIAAYIIHNVVLMCIAAFWMLSNPAVYIPVKAIIIIYYYIGVVFVGILGGYVSQKIGKNTNIFNSLLVTIVAITLLILLRISNTTQDTAQVIPEITGIWVDLLLIISIPFGGYLRTTKFTTIVTLKRVTIYLLFFFVSGVSVLFVTNILSDFFEYKKTLSNSELSHDEFIEIVGNAKDIREKITAINTTIINENEATAIIALCVLRNHKQSGTIDNCKSSLNSITADYYKEIINIKKPTDRQKIFKKKYLQYLEEQMP